VIKRLIGLSELQHQLSAQIGHYLDGEEIKVYPIDVFVEILFEKATHHQILPFLRGAINRIKTGSWGESAIADKALDPDVSARLAKHRVNAR
jgi:hypothetical protein